MASLLVLVAEDEEVNRLLALKQLEKIGARGHAVGDGAEVVEAVRTLQPDMVLMDCLMPDVDGFEAARSIRAWEREAGGHVPIIAMTANATDADRTRCFEAGMDDYLSKPVRLEDLEAMVGRWVPAAGGTGAAPAAPGHAESRRPERDGADAAQALEERIATLTDELGSASGTRSLIQLYLSRLPDRQRALRAAVAARDPEALRAAAHALRGTSDIFAASDVVARCRDLETLGAEGSMEGAEAAVAAVIEGTNTLASRLRDALGEG